MTVIKVNSTRTIIKSINYVLSEKSKDKKHIRLADVSVLNMTLSNACSDVTSTLKKFNKMDKVQGRLAIQSFAKEELSVDNPNDIELANKIGMETAKRMYGDRQILVATHCDNGLVHNHIVVCMPDIYTGKSLAGYKTSHKYAKDISDTVVKEFEVTNINNTISKERVTLAERKLKEKDKYIWKDDLRAKISKCSIKSLSYGDFVEDMRSEGVDVRKNGKNNISYKFTDKDGKQRVSRAKKLGDAFTYDDLDRQFWLNCQRSLEMIEQERLRALEESKRVVEQALERERLRKLKEAEENKLIQERIDKLNRQMNDYNEYKVEAKPKPTITIKDNRQPKQELITAKPKLRPTIKYNNNKGKSDIEPKRIVKRVVKQSVSEPVKKQVVEQQPKPTRQVKQAFKQPSLSKPSLTLEQPKLTQPKLTQPKLAQPKLTLEQPRLKGSSLFGSSLLDDTKEKDLDDFELDF